VVAWYRSFYWRIGVSFVLLVAVVLLLQSAFFGYWLARSNAANPEFSPNNRAARIAADLGTLLAQQPDQRGERQRIPSRARKWIGQLRGVGAEQGQRDRLRPQVGG